MKLQLLPLIVSLTLPSLVFSYEYIVLFHDEDIVKPCEEEPNNFVTKWADISHVIFKLVSAEEIKVSGYFQIIVDFKPNDTLYVDAQILQESWGKYQLPVTQIKRPDLCPILFNPNEIWYKCTSHMRQEERTCPPPKGLTYHVDDWSSKDTVLELPNPNLNGAYRLKVYAGTNYNSENDICFIVDADLTKK